MLQALQREQRGERGSAFFRADSHLSLLLLFLGICSVSQAADSCAVGVVGPCRLSTMRIYSSSLGGLIPGLRRCCSKNHRPYRPQWVSAKTSSGNLHLEALSYGMFRNTKPGEGALQISSKQPRYGMSGGPSAAFYGLLRELNGHLVLQAASGEVILSVVSASTCRR